MKKLIITSIVFMLTVSNFAHAQSAVETTAESSDFAPKQYSLSKNAADFKQAILNDIKSHPCKKVTFTPKSSKSSSIS